jgi:hypothetical protein
MTEIMKKNERLLSLGFPTMETILALESEGFFETANCKFGVGENEIGLQTSIEHVKLAPTFSEIWDVLPIAICGEDTQYFKDLGVFHIAYKSDKETLVSKPIKGNICETAATLWLHLEKVGYIDNIFFKYEIGDLVTIVGRGHVYENVEIKDRLVFNGEPCYILEGFIKNGGVILEGFAIPISEKYLMLV